MTHATVIICSHNPRGDYLDRTLLGLKNQDAALADWDLLLVDNASNEALADTVDLSWHPKARSVREDEVGLTPARLRGIREAAGDLLIFVDDDNILATDYLSKTVKMMERDRFLGVIGAGLLEPEFEAKPSATVAHLLPLLALRDVRSARWSNNVMDGSALPWGAGLCARKEVARSYLKLIERMATAAVLDRRGQELFSGGDDLFSWTAAKLGLGFGIFPELRITHLISAPRVDRGYLLRLVRDHSYSHGVLRYLLAGTNPESITMTRRVHMLLHGVKNGRFSMQAHTAEAEGTEAAARFIREKRLEPIGDWSEKPSE